MKSSPTTVESRGASGIEDYRKKSWHPDSIVEQTIGHLFFNRLELMDKITRIEICDNA